MSSTMTLHKSSPVGRVARAGILAVAVLLSLMPIYWTVNTSLKQERDVVSYPPEWVPPSPTVAQYEHVLSNTPLPLSVRNSIILGVGTIALVLVLGVHAAYAVARFRFRGKNAFMFTMLATIMIPGIVTLIPQYLLAVRLGLHDTHLALILVYGAWQLPMVVWIMRGFFEGIPVELDEAALVDGCSRLSAFYRIVLPLSWPGLAASAILVFVWVWNEFIIALALTSSPATRPLTVGLYFFIGETGIQWGRMAAGASVALIPVVVFFLILQKRFVAGLTAGAAKG